MRNKYHIHRMLALVVAALTIFSFSACSMGLTTDLSDTSIARSVQNDNPNKPFPQNESFSGLIRPAGLSDTSLNNDITALYDSWKNQYVTSMTFINGAKHSSFTGYYIAADANGWVPPSWQAAGVGPITQSEAHGYGMIITALMAGYDSQAKEIFDKMYQLAVNFPSSNNPDLMCWIIPNNGDLSIERNGSATDGDMDIAYALLLADKQWGGGPDISGMTSTYKQEAVRVINGLARSNVFKKNELGNTGAHFPRLAVGDMPHTWTGVKYIDYRTTRSSDFMLGHFELFAQAAQDSLWLDVKTVTEDIIARNQNQQTGLVADFYSNQPNQYNAYASAITGISDEAQGQYDDDYYYNSCRFPFRLAAAYAHFSNQGAKNALNTLNSWLGTKNVGDIVAGYTLNGEKLHGDAAWASDAFTAPFMAGLATSNNAQKLQEFWNGIKNYQAPDQWGTYYYENSVSLLSMLLVSGNWWNPGEQSTPVDTQAPTVPGTPVAEAVSSTAISIGWSASSDNVGVAGYEIYKNGVQVSVVSGSLTLYTADSLSPFTVYSFAIRAFDASGNVSALSSALSVTTTNESQDTEAPTPPVLPQVGIVTSSSISFSWQAASDNEGVSGYLIYKDGVQIAQVDALSLSFTADSLVADTVYVFSVKAFDAAGNISAMSEALSARTAAEIQNDVSVDYSINSWGSGYTATITITNNGTSAINNWQLQWDYATQTVGSSWSCQLVQNGTRVTVNPVSWNASIPAGGSISFGYNGAFNGGNTVPDIQISTN